jgi:hypothetical protein
MAIEKQTAANNKIVKWFTNIKNTRQNYKKVKASPYAGLVFALKIRKLVVGLLIPFLIYMGIKMAIGVRTNGVMGTVQRIVSLAIIGYICWRIYSTIPQAKKQIEYYKKYPHTINYCPSDVKEDIDTILAKIKYNAEVKEKINKANPTSNNIKQLNNSNPKEAVDKKT